MADENGGLYPSAKLDTSQLQIRLLAILAGKDEEEISCRLHTANANNTGEYEALSYAWGAPGSPKQITINDRPFWRDIHERNHQVQQMADVYSRAKQAVAWLGRSTTCSDKAAAFLREAYISGPLGRNGLKSECRWHDVATLCERNYWGRLWIIQEICLAPRVVVVCGAQQIPWAVFAALRRDRCSIWPKDLTTSERDFMQSYPARIDEQRTNYQRTRQFSSLWTLLETFQASKCQDFYDKVYGLMALSTDCGHRGIPVDYSRPIGLLYQDIMRFYQRQYRNVPSSSAGAQLMKLSEFLQNFLRLPARLRSGFNPEPPKHLFRIPVCKALMIQGFEPSLGSDFLTSTQRSLRPRQVAWALSDHRLVGSHDGNAFTGSVNCHGLQIPDTWMQQDVRPAKVATIFRAHPLGPIPASQGEKMTWSYGIAPPGAKPGDIVCCFVESHVAVVVRPDTGRVVGRAFFDPVPVDEYDGVMNVLARDRKVETTHAHAGRKGAEHWPATLMIGLESLRVLSWREDRTAPKMEFGKPRHVLGFNRFIGRIPIG
ncbi:hypothetical protein B0T16DRAFT_459881 [Cercophora newfieldiana]|uniref:Heterokaryon incompatibility domain-containing protein n=1 Tax=Cercophora newfieldiana TaxID=92897 RepID=A0AA40CNR2_9PEZI|nr:hypothetical protein B0T16DRAFT_459881 [Cercophora newfieldiana]